MSKKCTPLWREAHFQVKMVKTPHVRTTFGSWDVEKVHAVVARSTFPSQNGKNTTCSDHFLTSGCRKSARGWSATTTTTAAVHHTTSSSCGWGDHCNHCNHSNKHNSNHLSVNQRIRSAIRDSQQPTSPIGNTKNLHLNKAPSKEFLVRSWNHKESTAKSPPFDWRYFSKPVKSKLEVDPS